LVGNSHEIAISFLISSQTRAHLLSVLHFLCIGRQVVLPVLEYQGTTLRSPGQVPKVAIKRSGDGQTFTKGYKRATTEFSEANGAVPPKIHLPEPKFASESENMGAPSYEVCYSLCSTAKEFLMFHLSRER
jgi:hypothetical protein